MEDLPVAERPREKLRAHGPEHLSDHELLAIMLGSGTRNKSVYCLAREVLPILDRLQGKITPDELQVVSGLGGAKAALLSAAVEFARRQLCPERRRIAFPADVLPLVRHFADRKQEHFICLSLNGAHEVSAVRVVSVGLVNRTIVHPREVFADPVTDRAAAVIVCHNHPSGNVDPSSEDREVTRRLGAAGETLGIPLLDHLVFSERAYYSFLEHGEIES